MEYLKEGSPTAVITEARAQALLDHLLGQLRLRGPLNRVLLLPPDVTRLHSWAGFLTAALYRRLRAIDRLAILPALGTHAPMSAAEIEHMFPGVPKDLFHVHDWRNGIVPLGEVPASL